MNTDSSRWWMSGLILGIIAILIHNIVGETFIERWYSNGIYIGVRYLVDHSISLLPIAMTYLLFAFIVWWLFRQIRLLYLGSVRKSATWFRFLRNTVALVGWVIFLFYVLWGFNYDRIQLDDRLSWEVGEFSESTFIQEGREQAAMLSKLRTDLGDKITENLLIREYKLLEHEIRRDAILLAAKLGYRVDTKMRCRQLAPPGILLRLSTAGFYNPLTGECNIDKGLHDLQKPFVMAHEFFHGLGVTGEGDCNFLAYALCHQSSHPYIKYSGELGYWRYLRGGLYRHNEGIYREVVEGMNEDVLNDLRSIKETLDQYPDIAPRLRDGLYNAYLKSNKIPEGMANYSNIVSLVIQWRQEGHL